MKCPPAVLTAEELGALLDNEQLLREVGHAAGLADLAGNILGDEGGFLAE